MNASDARQISFENSQFSQYLEKVENEVKKQALYGNHSAKVKVASEVGSQVMGALRTSGFDVHSNVLPGGYFTDLVVDWKLNDK